MFNFPGNRAFLSQVIFAVSLFALMLSGWNVQSAEANSKYASFVMDADTGMVLYQRHADKKLHPASLTKVMTLVMLFEEMRAGRVQPNDRITISRNAANMVPSKLNIPAGSSIKVQDAIYALVTKSANDVAVAVAEHIGGSEEDFARMMTRQARLMGMRSTTFKNASGLHDPRQISTARDMAKMAQTVIKKYPEYYPYFSKRNFHYGNASYHNHNRLLGKYEGMDGMKTGYIQASGFNLVASAVRNNRRLIGVVFGGRSAATRNAHMVKLLDSGFGQLTDIRVANAPVPQKKPGVLLALSTLNKINPAMGHNQKAPSQPETQQWAFASASLSDGMFGRLIGEGDYDPAVHKRLETGLIAVSAHKGGGKSQKLLQKLQQQNPQRLNNYQPTAYTADPGNSSARARTEAQNANGWSIQLGAFTSRAATDTVIIKAKHTLPAALSGHAAIAPLRTENGWLYRARLAGYTREQAFAACRYIGECLPVAPQY